MRTVILGIETQREVSRRVFDAARGKKKAGPDRISFESITDLWRVLAPKRMEIVRTMTGAGPLTIREIARRVRRDFKAVHSDVTLLINTGIVERAAGGGVEFPYDRIHVEFDMMAA
jgi:predicted transcriptional regulator